jgi:hypothetical protein
VVCGYAEPGSLKANPRGGGRNLLPEFGGAVGVDRGFRDGVGVERRPKFAGVAGVGYGVCRCVGVGFLDFGIGGFVIAI